MGFTNNGLFISGYQLSHFNSHDISIDNNVNGKPLYYHKDLNNYEIVGIPIGQLILAGCSDINVSELHINNTDVAVEIAYCSKIIINGNNFSFNNDNGIYLYSSQNNNITGNNISSNDYAGIYLDSSNENNITGNNVSLNIFDGIYLKSGSNSNNVMGNNISENRWGIHFWGSSNDNIISRNNLTMQSWYGIYCQGSSGNLIHHNNLMDNSNSAFDDGSGNFWDNGYPSGGNYWSDYIGVDIYKGPNQDQPGSDGIGDANYSIDSDSIDNYPLMNPYTHKSLENYTILNQGWNLISIPLIQNNQNLTKVLEMIDGYYDAVQWYNNSDAIDPWKRYKVAKLFGNNLFELNETMSFWIHITQPGDTIFVYNGTAPTSNQIIGLHKGWNMVGYPSLSSYNRTTGLNNLTFDTHVDAIQWYDAGTKTWHFMGPNDNFVPGRGYWVHSKVDAEWEVPI